MRIEHCPCCKKQRKNGSPISYVWWNVHGNGRMCWSCYAEKTAKDAALHSSDDQTDE